MFLASSELWTARPFRFILVGIANSAIGLSVIFASKALLGWGDLTANISGYAVGLTVSFLLNRSWTFDSNSTAWSAALRFFCVFVIAYTLNLITVFVLIVVAESNTYFAQAAGIIPYTLVLYFASRDFVFRAPKQT